MVVVEIDVNYIYSKPKKKRTEDEMIQPYQVLLKWITETGGYIPKTHILYNEASYEFKIFIKKQ